MSRRKSEHPLQKVTLNLYSGDMDRLQELYPKPGAGAIIREIVRAHLIKIEENLTPVNIEIKDLPT